MGVRPLAFRMRAHKKYNEYGRFIRLRMQMNPKTFQEVQNQLKLDDNFVRLTAIKIPFAPTRPPAFVDDILDTQGSAMQQYPFATEGLASLMRRRYSLDYYAARTLLKAGLLSREYVQSLPRWNDKIQPDL